MTTRRRPRRKCAYLYEPGEEADIAKLKEDVEAEMQTNVTKMDVKPKKRRKKTEIQIELPEEVLNEVSVSGIEIAPTTEQSTIEEISTEPHIEDTETEATSAKTVEPVELPEPVVNTNNKKLETYTTTAQYCDAIQTGASEIERGLELQQYVARETVQTEMFESYMHQHALSATEAASLVHLTSNFSEISLKPVVQDEYKPITLALSIVDLLEANKINLSMRLDLLRGCRKSKQLRDQYETKKIYRVFAILQNRVPDPEYGELECNTGQRCRGIKYAGRPFMQFVSPAVSVALTQRFTELKEKAAALANGTASSSTDSLQQVNENSRKMIFESCYKGDPTHTGLCRLCLLRLTSHLYKANIAAYKQEAGDEFMKGNKQSELLSKFECEILQVHYYETNREGEYKSSACIPDNKMFAGILKPILAYNEDIWFPASIPITSRNKVYAGAGESDTVVYHGTNQQDFSNRAVCH